MKKILAIMLSLIMVVGLFAACGNNNATEPQGTEPQTTAPQETEPQATDPEPAAPEYTTVTPVS